MQNYVFSFKCKRIFKKKSFFPLKKIEGAIPAPSLLAMSLVRVLPDHGMVGWNVDANGVLAVEGEVNGRAAQQFLAMR